MKIIINDLETLITGYISPLEAVPVDKMVFKPSPTKWSKKEILGHLVDSAQNNIRRFVIAQYDDTPHIVYNQDQWVAISNYQQYDLPDLVRLWYLLNKHICHILENTSAENTQRTCRTDNQHSIEWLASDYIKHLRHHLHQILDMEPVAYP
jgi:hypothetical protein